MRSVFIPLHKAIVLSMFTNKCMTVGKKWAG